MLACVCIRATMDSAMVVSGAGLEGQKYRMKTAGCAKPVQCLGQCFGELAAVFLASWHFTWSLEKGRDADAQARRLCG